MPLLQLPQGKWGPPLPLSLRGRVRVQVGLQVATGRLVWVTGKKGCVVFIVLCLREPPPILQTWSDLIHCFQYPRCQKVFFLSFFFLLKHMSLLMITFCCGADWWSFYLEECKSHSKPKGSPRSSDSNPNVKSTFSVGVFSLLCGLLSPLHGSRMFQEKYGSNALELRCVF